MASIVKKSTLSESEEVIKVFVRVRPSLPREDGDEHAVSFVTRNELRVKSRTGDSTCKFDRVFPPQTSQEDVYNAVRDCAQNCIDGFNSTCFAYGQTGCGKTHTMIGVKGDYSQRGIIPNSFDHIFGYLDDANNITKKFLIRCSYLEIYNE